MPDLASFDFEALRGIWGVPRSPISGAREELQWHHIKGRGRMKDPDDRKIHSSVFNAIPLTDAEHDCGVVNEPELQAFFLRKAREKVFYAVARGQYVLTDIDNLFLEKYPL